MSGTTPSRAAKDAFISGRARRGITAAQVVMGSAAEADEVWNETAQAAINAAAVQPGGMDSLYRERAHLVAHLAAIYPSCIGPAPDADGWAIVYIAAPEQMTWHISYRDLDLFGHVHVGADEWDGHTTAEKYARLDKLTARRAGPAAATAGTEHLAGQLRDLAARDGRP